MHFFYIQFFHVTKIQKIIFKKYKIEIFYYFYFTTRKNMPCSFFLKRIVRVFLVSRYLKVLLLVSIECLNEFFTTKNKTSIKSYHIQTTYCQDYLIKQRMRTPENIINLLIF